MKTRIKFDGNKRMIIIQTPEFSTSFTQVTCLMTDEEYEAAKLERPDLVFKLAAELSDQVEEQSIVPSVIDDETKGITVKGLTLPHDLDTLITHLFEKEKV